VSISNQHIEELLAKHFAGETNAVEELQLNEWRTIQTENEIYYHSVKKLYEAIASAKNVQSVDVDAAWQKLQLKIKEGTTHKEPGNVRSDIIYKIAAAIAVIFIAAATLYVLKDKVVKGEIVSHNEPIEQLLPDSSTVFLNRNSSLTYSYSKKIRTIVLTGEAYFKVVHAERKFVVEVGSLQVEDVGTAFNIKQSLDSVSISVESGIVKLQSAAQQLQLMKGEEAIYISSTGAVNKLSVADPNALAYKTKILVFENASLGAVVQKLNEVYATNITIGDNLKECHFTSTFNNEKIEIILQVIAETLQLHILKTSASTELQGNSCN
jgi:transmembrane sensor